MNNTSFKHDNNIQSTINRKKVSLKKDRLTVIQKKIMNYIYDYEHDNKGEPISMKLLSCKVKEPRITNIIYHLYKLEEEGYITRTGLEYEQIISNFKIIKFKYIII